MNLSSGLIFTLTPILSLSVTQLPTMVVREKMNSTKDGKHLTHTDGSMLFFNLQNERKTHERRSFKKTEPDLKVITKNIGVTC